MITVCHISDTHNQHSKIKVPYADILIHSGDATSRGYRGEIEAFAQWFRSQPHMIKIFVAGNHDWDFETDPNQAQRSFYGDSPADGSDGLYYLNNSSCTVNVDGTELVVYGSPWTPYFHGWAFNAHPQDIQAIWQKIPNRVDFVVTHGPPKGILDLTADGLNVGCPFLDYELQLRKPKMHFFGHIHEAFGTLERDGVLYSNGACLNRRYLPANTPNVFEVYEDGTVKVRQAP